MKKQLRFLTNRCWIPLCLTNGWKIKWVLYLLSFIFIIFFILFLLGLALSQEKLPAKSGYVVFSLDENSEVMSFWFFDRYGNPQVYEWNGEKYISRPEKAEECTRCHITPAKI